MYLVKPEDQEREKIKQTLKDLSEYYGRTITDNQMIMYIDDLIDMGAELTEKAAREYRRYWGHSEFPFPAQLRGQIKFITRDMYVTGAMLRKMAIDETFTAQPKE